MRSIGIDLGEDSVKIVELIHNKKHVMVQSLFEKRLSPLLNQQDKEIECIEFIRDVLSKNDFSNAQFVMTIKQDRATVRRKTFPFSDRIKIQKSLSFEMEEDIPFDPDNCLFDYKVIRYSGSSADTLSIAVPKTHIEKIVQLAKDFNIQLKIISLEGFAFTNLLEHWDQSPPEDLDIPSLDQMSSDNDSEKNPLHSRIFLNIGHKRTLLAARIQGRVVFIRSLMWGADTVIQEIIKRYQLPYSEAQKVLEKNASFHLVKAHLSYEESSLTSLIEKCLKDLVRDLQMSFLELESELKAEVSEISMTGGFSQIGNLGGFLTQQLEVPCNPVNLIQNYLPPQIQNAPNFNAISAEYALAVGIALESYKRPRNPAIQFLKGEFADENSFIKTYWEKWGSLTQILAAAVVVFFAWTTLRESFSIQLNDKGTEALETQAKNVAKLPRKQANEKGIKKYISENKKRSQELKAVEHVLQMNSALDVLKKISESAPNKEQTHIDVIQLDITDSRVFLTGYANSPREVTLLNQKLSSLSINKTVREENTPLAPTPNRVAFALSFNIDRGIGARQ